MITAIEYVQLFALIAGCAFITYTVHEVGNAIHSMLHEND
jgi:Flp pilus assembly pilin Flp